MVTSSARRCYGTELEKNSRKVFATIQKQTKKFQTQNWLKFSLLMFQYSKSCLRQMFHFFQVCRRTSTGWCLARGVPTPLYTGYHHQCVHSPHITKLPYTCNSHQKHQLLPPAISQIPITSHAQHTTNTKTLL